MSLDAMIRYIKRGPHDEIYTPYNVAYDFAVFWKDVAPGIVWECTDPGDSNITKAFLDLGCVVVSSHIKDGFDFLTWKPDYFDSIVTNPPYSIKDKFIDRCYSLGKPFALLLPLTALAGKFRGSLFRKYNISLRVYSSRIDFLGFNKPWFPSAWFYWYPGMEFSTLTFVDKLTEPQ